MSLKHSEQGYISWDVSTSSLQAKATMSLRLTVRNGMRRHGKKVLMLEEPTWGIDVPSCRIRGYSPTFGSLMLFFFRKSTTRSYYLMNFSQRSLRGAEIWHIWKQHHVIECFWKIMKSIFQLRSMQLQGDGLYTALLIKVFAYLLPLR